MKQSMNHALVCAGAVIGAGFASGREIMAFFSCYGSHGWWLMALAAVMMTLLCGLVMRNAAQSGQNSWCGAVGRTVPAKMCIYAALIVTAGALTAASGQTAALVIPSGKAYPFGAAAALLAAWMIGNGNLKPVQIVSGLLIGVFVLAVLMGYRLPQTEQAVISRKFTGKELFFAAVRVTGYASMNMTLAVGAVCRCACHVRNSRCTCCLFGMMMFVLMGISHGLYTEHPDMMGESFPLIRILNGFGKTGFRISAVLMMLAVFTSLAAVIYAIRCAAETVTDSFSLQIALTIALPALVSRLGFSQIVDRLYAPAGLLCLLTVFCPLVRCGDA